MVIGTVLKVMFISSKYVLFVIDYTDQLQGLTKTHC